MDKLMAIFGVLRKGSMVANPELLKNASALAQAIAAFLTAVLLLGKAFGYDLQLTEASVAALSVGLAALVIGVYSTFATSTKVGIFPAKPVPEPVGDPPAGGDAPAAAPVGGVTADSRAAAQVWLRDRADNGGP